MRAVVQRVSAAKVLVEEKTVGEISRGLLVLLGVEEMDSEEDAEWLAAKIVQMRIFADANELMNLSVKELNGNLLIVSQFTLHASTKKGNRPSFIRAARPEKAEPLFQKFCECAFVLLGKKIERGIFGAMMQVELVNDGPVTIVMDSKNRE